MPALDQELRTEDAVAKLLIKTLASTLKAGTQSSVSFLFPQELSNSSQKRFEKYTLA